jgi:hypothetical protein
MGLVRSGICPRWSCRGWARSGGGRTCGSRCGSWTRRVSRSPRCLLERAAGDGSSEVPIQTWVIPARQAGSCSCMPPDHHGRGAAVDLREQPAQTVQIDQASVEPVPHRHPGRRLDLVLCPSRVGSRQSRGPATAAAPRAAPHRRRRRTRHARSASPCHLVGHRGHRPQMLTDRMRGHQTGPGGDPGPR